jgi:dCMP deaminase
MRANGRDLEVAEEDKGNQLSGQQLYQDSGHWRSAFHYPSLEESLSESHLRARPQPLLPGLSEPVPVQERLPFGGQHHLSQTMAFVGTTKVHVPAAPGPYVVPTLRASCDWPLPFQDTQIDDSGGRPSWEDTFIQVAFTVAARGTCPARRVGCVITSSDHHILATGYNGAPAGLPHCAEVGCHPDGDGRCTRAVHAEMNAVLQAAYIGVSIKGGTLYCTARPCLNCAKAVIQVGVARVIWAIDDLESRSRDQVLGILTRAGVNYSQYIPREDWAPSED